MDKFLTTEYSEDFMVISPDEVAEALTEMAAEPAVRTVGRAHGVVIFVAEAGDPQSDEGARRRQEASDRRLERRKFQTAHGRTRLRQPPPGWRVGGFEL